MKAEYKLLETIDEFLFQKRPEKLTDEHLEQRTLYEGSLYDFAKAAWSIVEPCPWIDGWHLKALAEHLEALYTLDINYLLVNMPPRMGKSLMCNAFFPAWCLAKDPSLRFLYTSYSEQLARGHHLDCRKIIRSKWYQTYWGKKYSIIKDIDSGSHFATDKLGFRMISTVQGKGTGFGSDFLCVDDPINARDAESVLKRQSVNIWWNRAMNMRWTHPDKFRRLVTMQRLHEDDLSGDIISQETNVVHLRLPMKFESKYQCITVPVKSTHGYNWHDPRTKENELLCPELAPFEIVEQKEKELGAYGTSGQMQQRPSPAEGGLLKKEWFQWWMQPELPEIEFVLQSWDTAMSVEDTACYSACTTWGIFNYHYRDGRSIPNIMLLSIWYGKVEMPELIEMSQRLANNYYDTELDDPIKGTNKPDSIIIEAKANGLSLIQELRRRGVPIIAFNPPKNKNKDVMGGRDAKEWRAMIVSPYLEAGLVWLPAVPPNFNRLYGFADEFMEECAKFPKGKSRDLVDTMSQAFFKIRESGWVQHPSDHIVEHKPDWGGYDKTPYQL